MSSSVRSRCSISKQRGAEMSSRLMPPNVGAIALQNATISSTSFVARQSGNASTPPNSLNRMRLALHHRHRRLGPDVAEPEHRGAVGDDRDRVLLDGQVPGGVAVVRDRLADARDARRVGHREVVARLERRLRHAPRSCRRGAAGTCGRRRARPRRRRPRAPPRRSPRGARRSTPATVTSRTFSRCSTRTRSIAPSEPPASPIAFATRANEPGASARRTRRSWRCRTRIRDSCSDHSSCGECRDRLVVVAGFAQDLGGVLADGGWGETGGWPARGRSSGEEREGGGRGSPGGAAAGGSRAPRSAAPRRCRRRPRPAPRAPLPP